MESIWRLVLGNSAQCSRASVLDRPRLFIQQHSHDRTPIPGFAEKAKRDMRSSEAHDRRGATPHGPLAARAFNFLPSPSSSCVTSSSNPVFILLSLPLFDSAIWPPPAMHQNVFKLIPTIPYNSPSIINWCWGHKRYGRLSFRFGDNLETSLGTMNS
ncbi:hypothetical protein BGW80DRAFT_1314549 [Lactifluus volemus]|nr:hypothetical protein BGW80DRAFT_1314549 [Lactifluus volemus]